MSIGKIDVAENFFAIENENTSKLHVQTKPDGLEKLNSSKKARTSMSFLGSILDDFIEIYNVQQFLYKYSTRHAVAKMIAYSDEVEKILADNDMDLVINLNNISYTTGIHMQETSKLAIQVMEQLKSKYNFSTEDRRAVLKGAFLHDFGKVLIPAEILEKNSKLTPEERKIIETHPQLGYELLKTTELDEKTLKVIKNHHLHKNGEGYPDCGEIPDILSQIVTIADIYTALTEKRNYKEKMSPECAMKIIDEKANEGCFEPDVVQALKKHLTGTNKAQLPMLKGLKRPPIKILVKA